MALCFDITQFVRYPAASGIQRVLLQIAARCDDRDRFVVLDDQQPLLLTPAMAEQMLRSVFREPWESLAPFTTWARERTLGSMTEDAIFEQFDGYVFSELTYDLELIGWWRHLARAHPDQVGGIFYDAAPELTRGLFVSQSPVGASAYFRFVAALPRVLCISEAAREQLLQLSLGTASGATVAPLGGDHLPPVHGPDGGSFVVIGDLKAKKHTDVAVHAFELVADQLEHRLVIIGRTIRGEELTAAAVTAAIEQSDRIRWIADASDELIAAELASASACVFIASDEGFGLPALEAIHAGVPVIADSRLPALRYVGPAGQIRLDEVTVESVAQAMLTVARDGGDLRTAVRTESVPSWNAFVESIRQLFGPPRHPPPTPGAT